jgi:Mlc titration factor MtfA (ptsG expression regulator)
VVLRLELRAYEGWNTVVVYPDEFRSKIEYMDDDGVMHVREHGIAGEAWQGGPVLLSWADVDRSRNFDESGMNLVIHEFAHKLDMRSGEPDGIPLLHSGMSVAEWRRIADAAYTHFVNEVEAWEAAGEPDESMPFIDPYAADAPEEFFAVCSEMFFAAPEDLRGIHPQYYDLLRRYYRQDLARVG